MIKKIIIFFILLCIIGISIFIAFRKRKNPFELELFGNIEIREVDLSFKTSGQIIHMYKEEGDYIKHGDLLAVIDGKDQLANYKKAEAEVEKIRAIKKNADEIYYRRHPLCFDNTISKQECDEILNNKNASEAQLKSNIAEKVYTKNQLDYTKLYALEDGIVTVRVKEPGATVAKGETIYTVAKIKPVWVRAYVNETDLGNIKYGMKAKIYTDTINPNTGKKREYIGYIGYISPVSEFTPKTVQSTDIRTNLVYRIRIYINNIDEFLRQGMPTTIKIDLDTKENDSSRN